MTVVFLNVTMTTSFVTKSVSQCAVELFNKFFEYLFFDQTGSQNPVPRTGSGSQNPEPMGSGSGFGSGSGS